MSEDEEATRQLEQYCLRQEERMNNERFMEFASRCSQQPQNFWRPEVGARFAFGSTEVDGKFIHPVYIVEQMRYDDDWFVVLITSRDPGFSCRGATVRVKFTALCGADPQPTGLSGPPLQLWQVARAHFGAYWPKRLREKQS